MIRALLALSLICPLKAQAAGTTAASLMNEPLGARPLALAGAYSSLAGDPYALVYNPAGLGLVDRTQVATYFGAGLADTNLSAALAARPLGRWGGLGVGLARRDAGTIEVFDQSGAAQTKRAQQDLLLSVGYGLATTPSWGGYGRFSAGASAKYFQSTLVEQAKGSAAALDLGGLWETPWFATLAASVSNLGSGIGYSGGGASGAKDPLPRTIRVGASVPLPFTSQSAPLLASVEGVKASDQALKPAVGLEYRIGRLAALRLGYKINDDLGSLTSGIGIKLGSVRFDYGFGLMSSVGNQHFASFGFEFGQRAERRSYADVRQQRLVQLSQYPEALYQKRLFFLATETSQKNPSLPMADETVRRIKDWVEESLRQGATPDAARYYYAVAYRSRFGQASQAKVVADLETALAHDSMNEELESQLAAARRKAAVEAESMARKSTELYAQALKKYNAKRYNSAIDLLRQALQANPGNQSAFTLLDFAIQASQQSAPSRAQAAAGAPAAAAAATPAPAPARTKQLAQYDTEKSAKLYIEGLQVYAQGDVKKAIGLMEEALKLDPFNYRCKIGLDRVRQDVRP